MSAGSIDASVDRRAADRAAGGSKPNILVLGGRQPHDDRLGWHLAELDRAARRRNASLTFADYESINSRVTDQGPINQVVPREPHSPEIVTTEVASFQAQSLVNGPLSRYDAILTRTMPAGSLEQITFRLATLHDEYHCRVSNAQAASIVNPPRGLELAIDKYATLARAARLGVPVPPTRVVQSRAEAIEAFEELGGDVVVKPIFGGEGRGVMRIREFELAWTVFSTLERVDAVLYVQRFIPPGGVDVRLLVIGDQIHAIRRTSSGDFRTNVKAGGRSENIALCESWRSTARTICDEFDLRFAAVDLIESNDDPAFFLVEVNAIPGWKSAQSALTIDIADEIVSLLLQPVARS
ncbi:ATP-grasp domain-containing protein [Neorhodopirellula pilleata]|uniref:Ribosomal protein S6 modification protein n=1 Tax=Neorhodopirellula pilleata TaxID=2714738 RepID=A0A5C5ZF10_9BACT|nr:RimK family alpha-L-glutamate ligase [Neorhodopirellula pilleata]TWT86029.1 Ribosomal protein S6 modification protein [Neorhodopirellula pilleata]